KSSAFGDRSSGEPVQTLCVPVVIEVQLSIKLSLASSTRDGDKTLVHPDCLHQPRRQERRYSNPSDN
ncbi:hypothetical protein P7K49_029535, partial [Saguinus oedipus]